MAAPTRCWCSIRPTATGAPGRCRPRNLRWSAYGSSFLVGPVEIEGRPFVDIRDVAFDPATRTFTLNFARGGSATLRLDKLDDERLVLDVRLGAPIAADRPFAALRSMFVTEGNSDVAQVGCARQERSILDADAGDGFQARERRRAVGRPARAFTSQHQRARHGVPQFQRGRALKWALQPRSRYPAGTLLSTFF